jgi:hypothetical protein
MDAWKDIFTRGCSTLLDSGPGYILALVMLYGLYRIVRSVGMKIVTALEKPTAALTTQANSMDRLTTCLQEYVARDTSEHREMIILLKLISTRLNTVEERKQSVGSKKRKIPEG